MANAIKYDSLIFDLDGTLWDANSTYLQAWNQILSNSELTHAISIEHMNSVMGMEQKKAWSALFPALEENQWKPLAAQIDVVQRELAATLGGNIYSGVEEFIPKLAEKYRLFIVSNCPKGLIESFFTYSGMGDFFSDYEEHGHTHLPKSDNIKLIVKRNELRKAVYIGDTHGDKHSAAAAGVDFKWVSYGFGQEVLDQGYDSFAQLAVELLG